MKKILGLGAALILIITTLSVGTVAYFNDVVTVTANSIAAGTLYLKVNGGSAVTPLSITGIKPVNIATTYAAAATNAFDFEVKNDGTLQGALDIGVGTVTNNENTSYTVETNSGDLTSGATTGELGAKLKIAIWLDKDADETWSSGDYYLTTAGSKTVWASGTTVPDAAFATVDAFSGVTCAALENVAGATIAGDLMVDYVFPHSATKTNNPWYDDNQAQSDGVSFNLVVTLTQS